MAQQKIRQENNFSVGVNLGYSPFKISDNESTYEYGFDTDNYPTLTCAKGRVSYGSSGLGTTRLLTNYGETHMVRAVSTKLQYNNTGTNWQDIAGTFADTDWDSTNFNSKLLLTNGTDTVKVWNGLTLTDLSANAPKGKYITNDTIRVWIAKDDELHYSAFEAESDWTSGENSGSAQYYTPNGGDITAIRRFYDRITVFKKDAMAEVHGRNYFNFQLVEISNEIGCVSFKTLQEVGDTLFWLGENDVYMYQGAKPQPIGEKIRPYLASINTAYIDKCCAWTDGIRYYLHLVTGTATEPNIRLVFDPRYNVWRIPALNENYRYAVRFKNNTYVGDASGQTYVVNTGTTNNGLPVTWSITSKMYDEGYPEAEKTYLEFHMQGNLPVGTTVTLDVSVQDKGNTYINVPVSLGSSSETSNNNVIIPLDIVPLTNWLKYRLTGTGYVEIDQLQRYYRIHRVQR
ncbi:hypothetical protein [Paenibacillus anseongense]|uniref:hypothetical protein n=1 Tax=Paenibacillus anseongense TaxID=2682845 RepID=UPI002DBD049E|nr:hypothetical protein [Paenibacillus anseongense]MEC0265131.1 hypothetical protein [Paenibacillus anseongense]